MTVKNINILVSPVGYSPNGPVTENVTRIIDINSVSVQAINPKGERISFDRTTRPDIVYLLVTEQSLDNAKKIRDLYQNMPNGPEVLLYPYEEGSSKHQNLPGPYDYRAITDRLRALKLRIDSLHPDEDITYFLNITPGTKIMTAAFASMSLFYNAYLWYIKDQSMVSKGESDYELFAPLTAFDPSKLDKGRREKTRKILSKLRDSKDTGLIRAELSNFIGESASTVSYNVKQLIHDGLVEEEDPTQKKNSRILITPSGLSVLEYLESFDSAERATRALSGSGSSSSGSGPPPPPVRRVSAV